MTIAGNLQKAFLDHIKHRCDSTSSFVDDLSDLLSVSKDSAYRRLRGETPLQFDEIQLLSLKYGVSVDQLFGLDNSHITFANRKINTRDFNLRDYLESIHNDLIGLDAYHEKEVTFAAKDIPPFHLFQYDMLTKFKLYFWLQNVEFEESTKDMKFSEFTQYQEHFSLTKSIWEKYMKVPSIEIWSDETLNIVLRHIFYYYDSGILSKKEALEILDETEDMLGHAKKQAERSSKFLVNKPESGIQNTYKLFYNEVTISDNTVFYVLDGEKSTIITYGLLNILKTSDPEFCNGIEVHLNNVISKSSLISSVSERTRNKVFMKLYEKIEATKSRII